MPGNHGLRALLALAAAGVALSGCGSDEISGEIPAGNAGELNAALDDVRAATESSTPNCVDAASAAQQFVNEVNDLPADPTGELKAELQAAGNHLRTLVSDECSTATTETTNSRPTTTEETTPSTTSTTTEETQTTTTTTTEETPPDEGGGGPPGGGPPDGGGTGGTSGGTSDDEDD
jgi:hypothetical protein